MCSRFGIITAAAVLTLVMGFASAARARPDHGMPYAWGHAYRHGWHGGAYPPGWSYGYRNGWNGGSYPPGWSRGLKRGWDGRPVPPGWYRH